MILQVLTRKKNVGYKRIVALELFFSYCCLQHHIDVMLRWDFFHNLCKNYFWLLRAILDTCCSGVFLAPPSDDD
jgi:hypothetical protein